MSTIFSDKYSLTPHGYGAHETRTVVLGTETCPHRSLIYLDSGNCPRLHCSSRTSCSLLSSCQFGFVQSTKMQGSSDTEGDFTIVTCPVVALRSLEYHDLPVSGQPVVQEQHHYLDETVFRGHLESVTEAEEQGCAQSSPPNPDQQNINLGILISRQFLGHPSITPIMPENLPRYSKRPKL